MRLFIASAWKIEMKKGILTLLLVLTTVCVAWAGTPEKIGDIVKQFSGREGFEVVNMGRFLLGALRTAITWDADVDEEDLGVIDAFRGIKHFTVVDFEDASEADKARFCRKVEKVLGKMELIMEAKDGGETLSVYGAEDGKKLKDIILYSSDGSLISMTGSILVEHIGELIEASK